MKRPLYQHRFFMHGRLARGGYMRAYEILVDGKKIGEKTVVAETRTSPEQVTYTLGGLIFDSAKAFTDAYEASLAREAPPEQGAA